MTPRDEINEKVCELIGIAERAREVALDDLIVHVRELSSVDRMEMQALALQVADWTHSIDGYRALLRRSDAPLRRLK